MLLQPFEEFKPAYLPRLVQLGRRYIVSQTYVRAKDTEGDPFSSRVNLLLSDYIEPGEAKLHFNAIKKDRYAAIIDLERPSHVNKLREILMEGSGYRVFFAVVRNAKELESEINKGYKDKLKQYVDKNTNWKISRDTIVKPSLQLSFGELFIILKHGSQLIRIKFEDIEES
jgi:hypothetical protein